MAAISRAGKIYRGFLKTLAEERPFYKAKDLLKEAEPIKEGMRGFKPEAYDKLRSMEANPSIDIRKLMGESIEPDITLNPVKSKNYGVDKRTFLHEMGHHLAAVDPEHPLSGIYKMKLRQIQKLPEEEQSKLWGSIEKDADRFMFDAEDRIKGREKNPKNPMMKWLKMLAMGTSGGTTMAGMSDFLGPSEAQAMPRGVIEKVTEKVLKGEVSSALKQLYGKVVSGKTVKDVRKGQGNWRSIIFDDDTMSTVTNTELNDLCRATGTKESLAELNLPEVSLTEKSLASLKQHWDRRGSEHVTRGTREMYHQSHMKRLEEMGLEPPKQSLVRHKDRIFTMPSEYANHLQEQGILKVLKEIKKPK